MADGEAEQEQAHFAAVLRAWDEYLPYAVNQARRAAVCNAPREHQALLQDLATVLPTPVLGEALPPTVGGIRSRLAEVDDRIRRNADVLQQVADFCRSFLGMDATAHARPTSDTHAVSEANQDRVRTALRQMARDWSAEGRSEREAAYRPLLEAVAQRRTPSADVRVLVPGAGLGRLAFEFALRGYTTQGNEFSYYMLIPSHFLLNSTQAVGEHVVYPYVHSLSNWSTAADLLQGVCVPDVLPSCLTPGTDFSMVAGEFVEVYAKPEEHGAWDVVATCYFLDTAKNVLRYIEVINALLPIGGLWVNLGPLLWHFEHESTPSLELTLDELLALLPKMGWEIEELRMLPEQAYTGNVRSMLAHQYRPIFFVGRKVRDHPMAPPV